MLAADGRPLKASLRRALRAQKLRALMLIAPLLAFVLVTFLFPIGDMLFRSVENQIVPNTLPRTVAALADWDAASDRVPGEPVFAALHDDLVVAVEQKTNTRLGSRLNYEYSGMSSLMRGVGRDVKKMDPAQPFKDQFIAADKKWGDPAVWQTIKLFSGRYTSGYLLNAARPAAHPRRHQGQSPPTERVYVKLFVRTVGDEPRHHLPLPPARLSDRLAAREPAAAELEPPADPRAAAVLDLAPGAHRLLEGAAAAAGRDQRRPGLARGHRRRQPAGDDQQRHRHDHRDDPHPPAVHDPAALLGDEDDPADLPARGEVARRQRLDRLLAGLLPADRSPASAPAPSSSSSWRSATTSPPSWSAAPPASSSRTGSPTTSRRR